MVTPVWAVMPIEVFLASTSGSALKSIVLSATMHFRPLWLVELLYVCLDRLLVILLSIWVSLLDRVPEIILAWFCWHTVNTMAGHIHWHSYFGMV